MLCEKLMKYPKNITLKGRFTHYENNGYLYFNSKDENDLERHCIFTCLGNLNNSYSKENNFYRNYLYLQEIDYKVGDVYAAIYPQDKMFYRVKILQILDFEKVLVCFIDYGNTEIIPKAELAPLPHQISQIKPLALLCKIPNIKLILEKSFMKIIQEICVNDTSITIESRTKMKIINEGGLVENLEVNLIDFQYNGFSIRDYLIRNKIAENFDEIYEKISLWPNNDGDADSQIRVSTKIDISSTCDVSPIMEYSKTVIITSVSLECNIFVHEFSKSVKTKLEALQTHISKIVENFKIRISDNMFNKRNMYLAQFSEDSLWYRCKINNFDSTYGFLVQYIDFGNSEYKTSLSELMLLSRDMGSDAIFLIDEEPIAQQCQLSSEVIRTCPSSINIRKYLNKKFVEPVKKLTIVYHINEEPTVIWLIKSISYHHQDLSELLEKQCVIKDINPYNGNAPSETSSHSIHNVADIKVADYLLNGCPELENDFFTVIDSNRQYMVTHIAGLDQIWIDIGDGQTQEMCDNLLAAINKQPSATEVVIDYIYGVIHVLDNGTSVATRCKIIDVSENYIKIHLIDKGPISHVLLDDIFNLTAEIIALPQQVLKFQLPENLIPKINQDLLLKSLKLLLEGHYVRLVRESLVTNILIDIIFNNRSLIQTMISKKVACIQDDNDWFHSTVSYRNVCVQTISNEIRNKKNPQSLYSV